MKIERFVDPFLPLHAGRVFAMDCKALFSINVAVKVDCDELCGRRLWKVTTRMIVSVVMNLMIDFKENVNSNFPCSLLLQSTAFFLWACSFEAGALEYNTSQQTHCMC